MVGVLSFLFLLSLVAIIVSLVLMLVRAIKKQSKKPTLISAGASAVAFVALFIWIVAITPPAERVERSDSAEVAKSAGASAPIADPEENAVLAHVVASEATNPGGDAAAEHEPAPEDPLSEVSSLPITEKSAAPVNPVSPKSAEPEHSEQPTASAESSVPEDGKPKGKPGATSTADSAPDSGSSSEPARRNLLLGINIQERPVMNGTKTERIGTWGAVEIMKEDLVALATDEQFFEFLQSVDSKNYNWFNIFFEDGTGIYYSACGGYFFEYGVADSVDGGSVDKAVMFTYEDGSYVQW